jgi:hypothetical protein
MGAPADERYLDTNGAVIADLVVERGPARRTRDGSLPKADMLESLVETRGHVALGIVAIRATADGKLEEGVNYAALSVGGRRIVKGRYAGGDGAPTPLRLAL